MKNQTKHSLNSRNMKNFFYHSVVIKNFNSPSGQLPTLDKLKKEYIVYLLKITNNNKTKTAHILNISVPGLNKKLEKFGLSN